MSKPLPFSLLPPRVVEVLAKRFSWLGGFVSNYFPSLGENLEQSGYDYAPREYGAIALIVGFSNAVFISILIGIVASALKLSLLVPLAIAAVVGAASFLTVLAYPSIIARRRARELERSLIPAVRQILIQLRAGVTLFDAMTSVSDDYGEVSVEFQKIVKRVNSGIPEVDVLADASRIIPSEQFKKVLWQISNAIKVGSDVSIALQSILEDLTKEQINRIHKYGQELSPWTMMYMMGAVIVPSLGITMLIVITSFLNIYIPKLILPVILFSLIIFQVFFMNFVASRRPTT